MRRKSVSRMRMVAMIVCGLLASGTSAMAQSNDGHCSNRTLFGDFGYSSEGVLLPAPGDTPIRGHARFPDDGPAIERLLDQVKGSLDLAEPFGRIREALAEARKMGVTNRA